MIQLFSHMNSLGYAPDIGKVALDGEFHRFDKDGNKDGWVIGHLRHTRSGQPYVVASFGSWKSNTKESYTTNLNFSSQDKKAIQADIENLQKKIREERILTNLQASKEAIHRWAGASDIGTSNYLERKKIDNLYGCKTAMTQSGREILVPMRDVEGKLWGIQRILPDGDKFFMTGQRKESCFHVIPDEASVLSADQILIAEGFATAASVYKATQKVTVVAFDAGNLLSVVIAIKNKYPDKEIVICGDDDRFSAKPSGEPYNSGRENASKAAEAVAGIAVFPVFKKDVRGQTDWNDLEAAEGIEEVSNQIINQIEKSYIKDRPDFKPQIVLGIEQESATVDKINALLVAKNKRNPTLFRRENKLVTLQSSDDGETKLAYLDKDLLTTKLVYTAKWVKKNKDGVLINTLVPERIAKHILNAPSQNLYRLDDVFRLPYFNSQKEFISKSGYHSSNFIYLDSKIDLASDFGKNVTTEVVEESKNLLFSLLKDFPFATRADMVHLLCTLFHPITRRLYNGPSPFFIINGTRPGVGKTLLADIVWLILLGTDPVYLGWPDSETDQEKLISSVFMAGYLIFIFDNLKSGKLESSVLARAGTQTTWSGRVLGGNEVLKCPNNVLWMFTVNNLSASNEIARRSPRIRLEPTYSSSQLRDLNSLQFPKIKEWVKANRTEILSALYTIVINWVDKGCPAPSHKRYLPSYENWSYTMGGILEAANIKGFLEGQTEYSATLDDETFLMESIFKEWWISNGDKPMRPSEIIYSTDIDNLFKEMLNVTHPSAMLSEVGKKLKEWNGRVLGEFKLIMAKDGGANKGRQYKLVKLGVGVGSSSTFKQESFKNE